MALNNALVCLTALSGLMVAASTPMAAIAASHTPSSSSMEQSRVSLDVENTTANALSNDVTTIAQATNRPRIAVLDFDYTPDVGQYYLWYYGGSASGSSDILVDRLGNGGQYRVVERSQIEAVLAEQNFGASGRVDASTAAQIGRILGVESVIIGSITKFNYDVKDKGIRVFGVGTRREVVEAEVQLNVRMVNTSTAEIIRTAEGNGQATDTASSVTVTGVFGQDSDPDNVRQVLSEAYTMAINEVASSLNSAAEDVAAVPAALPTQTSVIADITGSTLILNRGNTDGYRAGMCLSVERVVREILDPETQEVLRQITESSGQIELTDVDGRSSVGQITSGSSATLNVGDVAKPVDCP